MPNVRQSSTTRLARLRTANRRARPGEELSLDSLTLLWGSSKGQFTRIKDGIVGWPPPRVGPNNSKFYPAKQALKLLIELDQREVKLAKDRAARERKIMGGLTLDRPEGISLRDLATMSRLNAEVEQRERDQGMFTRVSHVQNVAARIFAIVSGPLSQLAAHLDPNGTWPVSQREAADVTGRDVLLKMHAEIKDMLTGHVSARSANPRGSGRKRGGARRAGTSRPG